METPDFKTRNIIIVDDQRRTIAVAAVTNAPLGIEVVLRAPVKVRKLDQNAKYWSGPLKDISEQAWVDGRQFSKEVWHEYFKDLYLPTELDKNIVKLVKNPDSYKKWSAGIDGRSVLVGSTTDLTVFGFSQFLEHVYAFGAGLGVMFYE